MWAHIYGNKTFQWTITSFILQSSHIMILNSTKLGGNRSKDVEVGPDGQTDSYIPPKLCLRRFVCIAL
jgi:hypothetical protein